ncbi:MAG: autotransporter-associated beta strand repeat-containing protein, partial [Kiritimatiellae bacterium]|nr:autotransporter-associated beta strand repeat-containing protein [Kiritimatiellia bacterium]
AISGDSAARIFKTGPGTLSLTAHNPFGGGVTVNEGTLLVDLFSWYQNPGHGNGKLIINQGALAEFRQAHAFGGGTGGKDAHINGGTLYFVNDNYVRTIEMTAGLLYGGGENRTVGGGTFTIYAAAAPSVIANRVNLYNNRTINVQDGAAAKDLIISGPISNSNGLTINGPGTVEFTGNNTYAGATLLANNATLLVNNTAGSGIGSGPVTINNGTLGGTGSIVGAVSFGANGGAIAPGASVGTLTVHSNVTFTSAASLDVTVDGIEAGEYSALVVNGAVDLADATLNVTLNTEISGGKPLFLIVNDGTDAVSGTFNNLPEGETFKISGTSFSIFYSADAETGATTGGNDVMLRSNPRGSLMIVR